MPTNVALTGLAKDLAARADTGKPVRIGLWARARWAPTL